MKKAIIFDASPLISMAMNGLLPEFRKLKENFDGKFLITKEVKGEIIDRPIKIKRFELEALKLQELINDEILEFPEEYGIKEVDISTQTNKLLSLANETFFEKENAIHLIDLGETSALVLSRELSKKGIENIVAIDERTTRMLCERPENLKKLLQKKFHLRVTMKKENLNKFKGFKIIRSAELMYLAYKKGLTKIKNKKVLDAILFSLKYKGCAISTEEIEKIKRLG